MKSYNFFAEVPSKSSKNKTYTIKVDENGLFSCNCPSWIYNHRGNRTCKHIDSLQREGLTIDGTGRLIIGVSNGERHGPWQEKVPILCRNYPEQCNDCKMRFICWTNREAEFDLNQLREMGIYKNR